ncbi:MULTISPECIES: PEP/pyruvate-binding domain-containing protein [Falsihalocynthiibacter]|uniref:PEP/pyruvate-binding domain-containing protein n=1 Tax=Falsihalocynthiibacter TaxID=2854182 RepID=UPI003002A088
MTRITEVGRFGFGTKAETLQGLGPSLEQSIIPDFSFISVEEWVNNNESVIDTLTRRFKHKKVAVRSSAQGEDSNESTMAGEFESLLDINGGDTDSLSQAIDTIIESYPGGLELCERNHQVLIQVYVNNVSMSGVVFTQDLNTGAPYYVINYDDVSGRTDSVTSGEQNGRTLFVHRNSQHTLNSPRFRAVLDAVAEIEAVTEIDALDIEFAVDKDNRVFLFQVRKITTQANWNRGMALRIRDAIKSMSAFAATRFQPLSGVYGSRSLFGQMPDWNPVEMIGSRPRPLAVSLYQRLITDRTWRLARKQMGYAEPQGSPLMYMFGGQPYIDARLSFHSYLPADLPPAIGHKLVDGWVQRLSDNPQLHDKVEFDVAITTLSFDFDKRFEEQCAGLLDDGERDIFKDCLQRLTHSLITSQTASIESELEKIETLSRKCDERAGYHSQIDLSSVAALLEDCVDLGTVPFSILARHGFIAQSFLKSLVSLDVLTQADMDAFMGTVNTVAGDLVSDMRKLSDGKLDLGIFLNRYGHLRPGAYDIQSMRYDSRPELIERMRNAPVVETSDPEGLEVGFVLSDDKKAKIQSLLDDFGYDTNVDTLFDYIGKATEAREYSKFVFTRNLSDALEGIAAWGQRNGLSRDELSFIPIQTILDVNSMNKGRSTEEYLRSTAETNMKDYQVTMGLHLPYLIKEVSDFHIVPLLISRPNFITSKSVEGEIVHLTGNEVDDKIDGKIVVIESADPGFDWIFTRNILGLITKFGGANSHMAIRCAEFRIPATIGAGEQLFEQVLASSMVELNCAQGTLKTTTNRIR